MPKHIPREFGGQSPVDRPSGRRWGNVATALDYTLDWRTPQPHLEAIRRLDGPAQLRLGLQQRAAATLRRHFFRGVRRVLVLVGADLSSFVIVRAMLRVVRDSQMLGAGLANSVAEIMPRGVLSGWQYAIALLVGLLATGNYGWADERRDPRRLFFGSSLATALAMWGLIWTNGFASVAVQYALTTVLIWVGLVAERLSVDRVVRAVLPERHHALPTLLVGPSQECRIAAAGQTFTAANEYQVLGFVDTDQPVATDARGHVSDFGRLLARSGAEAVVVCGYLADQQFHDVVDAAIAAGCQVLSVPRAIAIAGVQPSVVSRGGALLIELTRPGLRWYQLLLKRIVDLVGSAAALVILAPLFGALAAAVKLSSPGPVFFGHRRVGLNGRSFRCFKFRSMHPNAEALLQSDLALYSEYVANNYKLPPERDPRLTPIGRFLRQSSLDELPQLLNVLLGDMSLVGPRPIVPEELDEYGGGAAAFLSIKPGMTGAWQIGGRSRLGYPVRAQIELEYVRTWSLVHDVWIMLKTVPAVLARRGAH